MTYDKINCQLPAPCIIDSGILVNKEDMRRLLNDLNQVRYIHTIDGRVKSEGEGWLLEVFSDPNQSTLVANQNLYINVQSFDFLELSQSEGESYFDLVQDNRRLRLIPISSSLQEQELTRDMEDAALEAMLSEVLTAKWDLPFDDDDETASSC